MRVCFVVLSEMLTSVVPSQVLGPARAYATMPEVSVEVVFLEPARVALGRAARARVSQLRALWPAGKITCLPYVSRLGPSAPARSLATYLRATRARSGRLVLHCRGPEATLQGHSAARPWSGRIVFDARGASGPEATLRLASRGEADTAVHDRAFAVGQSWDRRAVENASAMLAVSQPLVEHLLALGNGRRVPSAVVPCCVERCTFDESARRSARDRLGVADEDLLLVHTSTEARWEAFDEVIDLFRAIHGLRPSRLLFLTTLDPALVTASLAPEDPMRARIDVRRAAPHEVAGYLSAADIGLLLRRPHETHRLASPIKFAEYLGAGLAAVVSEGIGTIGSLVRAERVGVVIRGGTGSDQFEAGARELIALLEDAGRVRERAMKICRERFTWERQIPTVRDIYGLTEAHGSGHD